MKNKKYSWWALRLMCLMIISSVAFTACDDDDDIDTNQLASGEVLLKSFGPSPAMRGGELRFIGTNLDKVTGIKLPGVDEITDITKVGKFEIRITIPQTAEPGIIVLNTPKGEITTKTPISYSEPISISSVAPLAVKPGATIKIEGEYLNIVEEIIFYEGVHVLKEDFVSQSRKAIEVKVPVEAQSGKIIVSDGADLLSDGEDIPVWIYSEEELDVTLPTYEDHSPTTPKAGNILTITGKDLDLVASVKFEGAEAFEVDVSEDAKTLTLMVPKTANDGEIKLVSFSGVEVLIGDITLVQPTAVIEDKKVSYGVDDVVVISGTNLDLVSKAAFTNGEEIEITSTEDGKINLTVTEAAQSGVITLFLTNGNTVPVTGFEITKPVADLPADATPLDELDIVSTLGNRVKTVKFGNLEAEATPTGTGFQVTVPLEAETGNVTLVMDNGETVEAGSIVINSFTFTAISKFAAEATTIGELFQATVMNGKNLTNVLLNGEETPYLLVGTVLYAAVGTQTGDIQLTLVSGTTEVDYTIIVEASGVVETMLYTSPIEIAGWANHEMNIDFSSVPDDAVIRIRYNKTNDKPEFKVYNGHWEGVYDGSNDGDPTELRASDYLDFSVSTFPYSDWGYTIIFQGEGLIISSVSWVKDYSAQK